MRRTVLVAAVLAALCSLPLADASDSLVFTTTLSQETGNNTSAADSFQAQSNGNAGAGNVSKMPIRGLLYPGATTRVYAHFMPWFGGSNHMNVGYRSDSAEQVRRQVADMMSRSIEGAIVDWYGPDFKRENDTTLLLMKEAELHLGKFEFAIMEDAGALKKCANTAGCDVTERVILDLNYAAATYYPSPAYMRVGGRPAVFFFGMGAYNIDWDRVRANVQGDPLLIFRNSGGFTHTQTNGSFSWLATQQKATHTPGYMSLGYLDDFYKTGLKYPAMLPYGSGFPGFDDSLSGWGRNRYIGQYCGQTWLESMARSGRYYSEANQLHSLQLVTWNDYEEGSSIESGIDNCLSVSVSLSGTQLSWSLVGEGSENTVDHFNVFLSTDGENLARLAPLSVQTRTLDLAAFALAPGTYQLLVQAYGKPSIHNKMSAAVTYVVATQLPAAELSVTPDSGIAPAGVTASTAGSQAHIGSIESSVIDFGDGHVASGTTVSHTYSAAGSYTVSATVTDTAGQSSTATQTVTVHEPFVSIYEPAEAGTVAPAVRVTAQAFSGVEVTVMQVWVDGVRLYDGPGDTVDTTLSLAAGARRITVQGMDRNGDWWRSRVNVTVAEPPTAELNVTPESGLAPHAVTASTEGSQGSGAITSSVDFGDGQVVSGTTVSHTYSAAGTYTVRATVTDSVGQTASTTRTVTVNAPYVSIYEPTDGAALTDAVRVQAGAFSGAAVDVMQIWVDGVRLYDGPGGTVDTTLSLEAGSRGVTVQARDAAGVWFQSYIEVTVIEAAQAEPEPEPTPEPEPEPTPDPEPEPDPTPEPEPEPEPEPTPAPNLSLAVSPAQLKVKRGQSGSYTLTLTPEHGFEGAVSVTCSGLPAGAQCSPSPLTVSVQDAAVSATMTVTTSSPGQSQASLALPGDRAAPLLALWLSLGGLPLAGLALAGAGRRALCGGARRAALLLLALVMGVLLLSACGGAVASAKQSPSSSSSGTSKGTYTVTFVAVSGELTRTATATLIVE